MRKTKGPAKEPVLRLVSTTPVTLEKGEEALAELRRIPKEERDLENWRHNGSPRRRTDAELEELKQAAERYSHGEFEKHKADFSNQSKLTEIIKTLKTAYFDEQREYLYWAADMYYQAAHYIMSSFQLNNNNLTWAGELAKRADSSFKKWAALPRRGGDEFRELGLDISDTMGLVAAVSKLNDSDLKEILKILDVDRAKYSGKLKDYQNIIGTDGESANPLDSIISQKFNALVKLKSPYFTRQAEAARILTHAAETAAMSGSAEFGRELAKFALSTYNNISKLQEKSGAIPNIEVKGSYDYLLFHVNLKKLLTE